MFNIVTPNQHISFSNGHVSISPNSVEFQGEMKFKEHQLRISIRSTDNPNVQCVARVEVLNPIMQCWDLVDQILPIKMQTQAGTNRMPQGTTWEENFEDDIDTLYEGAVRHLQY